MVGGGSFVFWARVVVDAGAVHASISCCGCRDVVAGFADHLGVVEWVVLGGSIHCRRRAAAHHRYPSNAARFDGMDPQQSGHAGPDIPSSLLPREREASNFLPLIGG